MTDLPRTGAGRVLAGRYRLDRHLASGGMAEVWEATDEVLGRPVAVKILHGHLADDPDLRARFHHEAVAAARLVHPSIVAIYDTCEESGVEAIVMELVRGRTLRRFMDERVRLDPVEVVHIGAEVAAALGCAHRSGIVHRDVKPANILLSDDGRVLVTDFGIAKVLDGPDVTSTSQMLGTVKYLSPEQVEGAAIDARTDVYALGAVLYEALCGEAPFRADNQAALALARLQRDPRPPHDIVAGVPPALDAAVMRALARRADDRFASADAFRTALLGTRLDHGDERTMAVGRGDDPTVAGPRPSDPAPTVVGAAAGAAAAGGVGGGGPRRPDDTPGWGTPAVSPRGRRRIGPGVVVSLAVVVALVLVALLVATTDLGHDLLDRANPSGPKASDPASPVSIASAHPFDPQGDANEENDELAAAAVDSQPSTGWRTETYESRAFGNLKDGVGLVVSLASSGPLETLTITSPSTGWAASVYVAEGDPTTLAAWGEPVAQTGAVAGGATLDLGGARGSAVLIWITDLGDGPPFRVSINEVGVTG